MVTEKNTNWGLGLASPCVEGCVEGLWEERICLIGFNTAPGQVRYLRNHLVWRTWTALEFRESVSWGYIPWKGELRSCWYYTIGECERGFIADLVEKRVALLEVTNLTTSRDFPRPIAHSANLLWFPTDLDAVWMKLSCESGIFQPNRFTIDRDRLLRYIGREE